MGKPTTNERAHPSWRRVGRYELGPRLAKGGMAELCIARATGVHGFEKYVAIKRILPKWAGDREFVEMFLDEARLAAQLDHPNVVHVHDLGEDADAPFFAMDYIHGENLLAIIRACRKRDAPLAWPAFVAIASAAAAGLHHAHDRCGFDGKPLGIIHRDVSPTNVIASYEGALKIVDFGIAKAATSRHATRPSVRKGKMAYMSPEQCRGETLDRRSDLFALGIVLYELATLKRAFDGDGDFAVMNQIVNHDMEPPSTRAAVPDQIEAIVMRLLARDRQERYASGRQVQRALDDVASALGLSATPAAIAAEMESLFGTRPFPWVADVSEVTDVTAEAETREVRQDEATAATVAKTAPLLLDPPASEPVKTQWAVPTLALVALGIAGALLWSRGDSEAPVAADPGPAPAESAAPVAEPPSPPAAEPRVPVPVPDVPPEYAGSTGSPVGSTTETGGDAVEPVLPRSSAGRSRPPRGKTPKPRPTEPTATVEPSFDPDAPAPRPR